MMMTTAVAVQLPESLQALVDSRLDTIDRMLMGRVPRQDRLAIVREVEAQVFELLQERDAEELSREDVLAVLARLDPPEAYLPEETGVEPTPARTTLRPHAARAVRKGNPKVAKVSGIIGLLSIGFILLIPPGWAIAAAFQSQAIFLALCGCTLALALVTSILAVALGIYSRMGSAWAVVGVVTSVISFLLWVAATVLIVLDTL